VIVNQKPMCPIMHTPQSRKTAEIKARGARAPAATHQPKCAGRCPRVMSAASQPRQPHSSRPPLSVHNTQRRSRPPACRLAARPTRHCCCRALELTGFPAHSAAPARAARLASSTASSSARLFSWIASGVSSFSAGAARPGSGNVPAAKSPQSTSAVAMV